MSIAAPPNRIRRQDLRPTFFELPEAEIVWRVHHEKRPDLFNPAPHLEPFDGGRFDSNHAYRYPFSYLAREQETALTEYLLRGVGFRNNGSRLLQRKVVRGRRLIGIRPLRALHLLDLRTSVALAGIFAEEWLIQCGPEEYPRTRAWAHWLRGQLSEADGFIWPSKRNIGGQAIILFGDKCHEAVEFDFSQQPLTFDEPAGVRQLNELLKDYRVTIPPPQT